jgi:site-specific recombinase XerD
MATRGRSVATLDESALETYVEHRGTQRERRHAAAVLVLAHLRAEGVTSPAPDVEDPSAIAACGQRFATFMRTERGAAEGTVEGYVAVVREFLDRRFGSGDVAAPALSPKRVAYLASALRSFFRFLFVQGETATDLSTAPLMSQTKHRVTVPRYLSPREVERLIDTCDRGTPAGRRDRAILVLLVRLGLRAGEVAALELDDIRWRSAEIVVRGKGNVVDRLPLLSEVGEALSSYLANDRAADAPTRRVFLRLCAPVREVAGRTAVSVVVRRRLKKAGIQSQVRGAHLLRHTLGTQMIRAGASMAEIAEVLRHRSPRSSAIYAKVDFEALRTLAQPWPGAGGAR